MMPGSDEHHHTEKGVPMSVRLWRLPTGLGCHHDPIPERRKNAAINYIQCVPFIDPNPGVRHMMFSSIHIDPHQSHSLDVDDVDTGCIQQKFVGPRLFEGVVVEMRCSNVTDRYKSRRRLPSQHGIRVWTNDLPISLRVEVTRRFVICDYQSCYKTTQHNILGDPATTLQHRNTKISVSDPTSSQLR